MELLKELQDLLRHPAIWRGDQLAQTTATLSTGFAELDAELPGGGWARAGLTELQVPREGAGELSMLLPALAQVSREHRWVVFVAPPYLPYAPALGQAGIDLSRYMLVRVQSLESRLWAIEQALRSGACGAVLFWANGLDEHHLRRLQLAAVEGDAMGFCFDTQPRQVQRSSPVPLRLALRPGPGAQLDLEILKRRGGQVPASLRLALPRGNPVLSTPLPPSRGRVGRIPAWRSTASAREPEGMSLMNGPATWRSTAQA
ncbi:MAG: translesion DNA synthesis-associated protein ImuA [Pseudomonadota bacterium]|nr:translesion DNA synthesis-associated protein ImuA [Pseudomonadota bacterium]